VVVTLPQNPEASEVIGNAIVEKSARAVNAARYVPPLSPGSDQAQRARSRRAPPTEWRSRYPLEVMGKQIWVETSLVGRHQLRNVALAIATAEELSRQGFPVSAEAIGQGLRDAFWPGRFQVLARSGGEAEYVFDVAHNPAGAWALRSALSTYYEGRRLLFVFGAMRDKAIGEMAEILFPLSERVIATCAANPRSASAREIREAAGRVQEEIESSADVGSALERARRWAGTDGVVVVTGSIYVVGEAMGILGVSADAK
jgi:dihydrofolate synthase/folylpolyglutamate synthase